MAFVLKFFEWLSTFESHSHRQFAESMIIRDKDIIKNDRND